MKRTFTSLVLGVTLLVGGGGAGFAQSRKDAPKVTDAFEAYRSGDFVTAAREWRTQAEQGNEVAQVNLGLMYEKGKGVTQDFQEAVRWYRLSAEQGEAHAQFSMGVMYREGRGVAQDYRAAVNWFRLAASQGHADAQSSLGAMYGTGRGVIQDYIYAHMWSNIAAINGKESSVKNRDTSASRMTKEQIAQAQELARRCVAKNYKGC
jgi:hypothetical protein